MRKTQKTYAPPRGAQDPYYYIIIKSVVHPPSCGGRVVVRQAYARRPPHPAHEGTPTLSRGEQKKNSHVKGVKCMRGNLKEARQKAGMTQQQMVDRLDSDVKYAIGYGSWTGRRNGEALKN